MGADMKNLTWYLIAIPAVAVFFLWYAFTDRTTKIIDPKSIISQKIKIDQVESNPAVLFEQLGSGLLTGQDLQPVQTRALLDYINTAQKPLHSTNNGIIALHEFKNAYLRLPEAKNQEKDCLQELGEELASPELHTQVHRYLNSV